MTKNYLLLFSLFLCTFFYTYGQSRYDVLTVANPVRSFGGARMCMNDAGTITGFSPITGQSNDGTPDTIYLCLNDQISVDHTGNALFPGDPDITTDPGVGYWITNCQPTVSGDNRDALSADFCNITDPAPVGGIFLYSSGSLSGDETFINNGALQGFLSAGEPDIYWFSPITFDAYNSATNNAVYEGLPEDECLHVSVDQGFAIAFLNEITITEINNGGVTGCVGSFRVQGGLPELENNTSYTTVTIYNQADPTIEGVILDNTTIHDEVVDFYVPQPGTYVIEIEDGKSCDGIATVDMGACQDVVINLPLSNALPGENICLEVTVEDFVNVGSIQGVFSYDPTVLSFTGVQNINPAMPDINAGNFNSTVPGVIRHTWQDLNGASITLPNGSSIFDLCFQVIGQLGDCSPLGFAGDDLTILEIGDGTGNPDAVYGVVINDGKVNISDDPFFAGMVQDSLTCPSDNDGTITITVDDGVAPYLYSWNTVPLSGPNSGPFVIANDGDSDVMTGLAAGLYQITVTDSSVPSQMVVDTVEVFAGPDLGASITFEPPSCFGGTDAVVTVGVSLDGVSVPNPGPDITYLWNVPDSTTQTITNQPDGFYAITITDASGCTAMASVTVTQPPQLRVLANNTFITNASCTGGGDGEITLTATGGTVDPSSNYTYTWEDGQVDNTASTTLTGLNPGEYCVTVTDDNDCEFTGCYTVGAVKLLTVVDIVMDVNCNGEANGEIFITGNTAGAPADVPYTFTWDSGAPAANDTPTTSEITGLTAGTYFVTMTDASAAGCEVIDSFEVNQPESLVVSLLDQVNETCLVGNDGSIVAGVVGGTFPYTYTWSHDGTLTDSVATDLSMNNYVLDVADLNGCTGQLDVDILAPTPPSILTLDDDSVSCPDDTDGVLTVTAQQGGAPIDNYTWDNGMMGATIMNLAPGQYIVTVTAEDACTVIDTALVLSPEPIVLDSFLVSVPTCPGDSDGQIALFISGGTSPYNFEWSDDVGVITMANPYAGLGADTYSVTISDNSGCDPVIQTIVVDDPPSVTGVFSDITDTTCPNDSTCDGQATFTASYSDGTAGLFNITWLSSATSEMEIGVAASSAVALCEGPQQVQVSDGACGDFFDFVIEAPEEITVGITTERASCNGDADGTIDLTTQGGTAPYDYFWTHSGETTPMVGGLAAGSYTAVITDANGCSLTEMVGVGEPDELQLTLDPNVSTDFVSCAGDMDGIIAVVVNTSADINPIGPAPYTWSNGIAPAAAATATGLTAGTYGVTVTDVEGCMDELSFTILEPAPIVLVLDTIVPPACFGDATFISIDTVFGGAGNVFEEFTFMVDNNGLNFPVTQPATVFAGDHIITVEDVNGCTEEGLVSIIQPGQVQVTLPDEVVVELGDSTVQLLPLVTPAGNYTYQWTPATYLSSDTIANPFVFPEASLEYSLTVTNENNCLAVASVFVELDANRNVYVPNIFTPNGDGYNDEFRVFTCLGVSAINSARVFDRWGGLVYEGVNLSPSCLDGVKLWDGDKSGTPLNAGVYVYMIEVTFLDGVTLIYRGDVALIR